MIKKVCNDIFIVILSCSQCCDINKPSNGVKEIIIEAENYTNNSRNIRLEEKPNASKGKCVHIGPDNNDENSGIGDEICYYFNLLNNFSMGIFEICYSDDMGGNIIHVYLDDKKKGCFRTQGTGGWNNFILNWQKLDLGELKEGAHTIKLEMTKGGSYGVLLDYFKITNVERIENVAGLYNFIKSQINEKTGLVKSSDYENNFTTVYKNSLAAMVFIHQNDLIYAERIFDFFISKYSNNSFNGFNKNWDPEIGIELEKDHWEGDNAFLLLSLNYYKKIKGNYGNYENMVEGLVKWLSSRIDSVKIAEGFANMYAALKPFENIVSGTDKVLSTLKNKFNATKNYDFVLDHIERGALCFSDIVAFNYIDNFRRTETWSYNDAKIELLSAFSDKNGVNVEISAQTLLAWKIWRSDLSIDLSYLKTELDKVYLLGSGPPHTVSYGLPYYLSGYEWNYCYDGSIIDPVCYMLFYYWDFNPMAPGLKGY